MVDALLEGWTENSHALTEENQRLTEGFDQANETIKDLKAKLMDALRQLAVHENHNNPSSKATLFAKKRKSHRRAAKKKEAAAGDTSTTTDTGGGVNGYFVGNILQIIDLNCMRNVVLNRYFDN